MHKSDALSSVLHAARWVVVATLLVSPVAPGAVPEPTPAQLDLLKQLSPEQRQALAEELTKEPSTSDAPLSQPEIAAPRPDVSPSPPEAPAEAAGLKRFGYDLFREVPTTFAPATDIPVPADYVLGPGDTVRVQLYGKENGDHSLVVGRDGQLSFPGLGPVAVSGLRYPEMEAMLLKRVAEQMIGVRAAISMGPLRSIRVFVLGEAVRPGSYTVSALSTITNALFISGGVREMGSLRDIQLKRDGRLVSRLDLYDLLLKGDTSGDARLQPGDVLFIPPVGTTAGISGEVRRPAIYELRGERFAKDLIRMAGGVLATAYPQASRLERIDERGNRTVLDADLTRDDGQTLALHDGDVLTVYSVLDKQENIVVLSGHVQRPGTYQWRPGMKLLDLVRSVDDLQPRADLRYVVIKRELRPQRYVQVVSTRMDFALTDPASRFNLELLPRDEVIFLGIATERAARLEDIVAQIKLQATLADPEKVVVASGNVMHPGAYPLEPGMRVSDLVRAAFELKPETDFDYALLRRETADRRVEVLPVRLRDVAAQPSGPGDPELRPRDQLYVFSLYGDRRALVEPLMADLRKQATAEALSPEVSAGGSVRHTGSFPLVEGMKVSDLLRALGPFNQSAFLLEAELTRYQVDKGQRIEIGHEKVDLAGILAGNAQADVALRPYDHLLIKQVTEWRDTERVELKGEVRFPGSYVIKRGETLRQIIERAGGLTDDAFAFGAVFTREELRLREQKQIEAMRDRMRADLAAVTLETISADPQKLESYALAKGLLTQLETAQPVGRMSIDLPEVLQGDDEDVELRGGDVVAIPRRPQEVTVIGEVNYPTSHLYEKWDDTDDYIDRSGGATYKADMGRAYVVRANGEVVATGSSWFGGDNVEPGDTIVVPVDADRVKPLFVWSSVAQIVYQLGLAAAAFHAIGAF